jgi:hypothetical protein
MGLNLRFGEAFRAGVQTGLSMDKSGVAFSAVQLAGEVFYYPKGRAGRGLELGLREYYLARLGPRASDSGDFFNPMALGMFGMGFHTHATLGWAIQGKDLPDLSMGARIGGGVLVPTESGRPVTWSVRMLELHMGVVF